MKTKQILSSSAAALAIVLAGTVAAEQPATPFVSGDTPMNVGQEAQVKNPTPNAAEQAATEKMLKNESEELTGEYPTDMGDQKQIKNPTPNAAEQQATSKMLKNESEELTGEYPTDMGDQKQIDQKD
ncbi:hypothetical protein [Thiocapsa bogorovii]|uniref:hypothetical protein n=1 Tax=Thiocapsa bogorovii TaxID=521689 RepID=UPI001E591C21|nr:hypothetical protein [Thiocapsa bogorovii]UHD16951.1 hypothetical protein LT988_02500 [Thiocapsa bogorovii]